MKESIGFRMNLETAEEFFKRCHERKAESKEERLNILRELVNELKALAVNEDDLRKLTKGKKILHIKRNSKNDQ